MNCEQPPPEPFQLHLGESLAWLPTLAPGSVDAVITDPPYSSGATHASGRKADPSTKYTQSGSLRFAGIQFDGDNRDQRSWTLWCTLWLSMCRRLTRPGGYVLMFSDWRQLPPATDALQAAGFTWRGVIAWDKGIRARSPHTGYFRHQCEYVVWGTNGSYRAAGPESNQHAHHGGPWPGCFSIPVLQSDKHHPTGKPTPLMQGLVQCVPPGSLVVDPFAGSGTTGVAALLESRRFLGCESHPDHHATALARLREAAKNAPQQTHDQPPTNRQAGRPVPKNRQANRR